MTGIYSFACCVFLFVSCGMVITQCFLISHMRKIQQGLQKTFGKISIDDLYEFFDKSGSESIDNIEHPDTTEDKQED